MPLDNVKVCAHPRRCSPPHTSPATGLAFLTRLFSSSFELHSLFYLLFLPCRVRSHACRLPAAPAEAPSSKRAHTRRGLHGQG